jgi:outer membrane protein assembly factor BamB
MSGRSRWVWLAVAVLAAGSLGLTAARYWPKTMPVPPRPSIELAWMYESPRPGAVVSSPLIDGERVFVGVIRDEGLSPKGTVVCLDRNTGKPVWTFDDGGEMIHMFSSPRVSGGRLYIGEGMHANFSCKLYCLDAATGRKHWAYPVTGHVESTPCVANGAVFFGAGDAGLVAVDAATGSKKWQFAGTWHIDSSPAVVGGRVFVGSGVSRRFKDTFLFCLDANDMDVVWRVLADLPAWGSPVVDAGQAFFGLGNGRLDHPDEQPAGALLCLDAATGHELWRRPAGDGVLARPCVDETRVYFARRDGTVTAVDRTNGQPLWSRPLGSPVVTTPARLGDRLYVAASAGTLFALNAQTGDVLATFDLAAQFRAPAKVYSSPAVVAEPETGRHFITFGAEVQTANGAKAVVCAVRY